MGLIRGIRNRLPIAAHKTEYGDIQNAYSAPFS